MECGNYDIKEIYKKVVENVECGKIVILNLIGDTFEKVRTSSLVIIYKYDNNNSEVEVIDVCISKLNQIKLADMLFIELNRYYIVELIPTL